MRKEHEEHWRLTRFENQFSDYVGNLTTRLCEFKNQADKAGHTRHAKRYKQISNELEMFLLVSDCYDGQITYYEKLLEDNPENKAAKVRLAEAFYYKGESGIAENLAEKLKDSEDSFLKVHGIIILSQLALDAKHHIGTKDEESLEVEVDALLKSAIPHYNAEGVLDLSRSEVHYLIASNLADGYGYFKGRNDERFKEALEHVVKSMEVYLERRPVFQLFAEIILKTRCEHYEHWNRDHYHAAWRVGDMLQKEVFKAISEGNVEEVFKEGFAKFVLAEFGKIRPAEKKKTLPQL